jgi:bifunctional UDP-N-acetylglucosamine pyrophosphorylase/glucosamine-1-phosphate N-acetyltransferase
MSIPKLNVVILAAGKGTRMFSDLPKVLHPIAGMPMLAHVVDTARQLNPAKLCVVYGFGGDAVPRTITGDDITWVLQEEQKGTGHAVQQAIDVLQQDAVTLVLFGDVPLIRLQTCQKVVSDASQGNLALLTVDQPNPAGYGRIVRNSFGAVTGIVEHKDASEQQRQISEVNTGIMAMPTDKLAHWLQQLNCNNAQGEYYLTDVVAQAVNEGVPVSTSSPEDSYEVFGVNSKKDLAHLEKAYQRQLAETLLDQGVTLLDPDRIDIRGSLKCGKDVSVDINCVFEGQVELGAGVVVGAHCVIRNSTIGTGVIIAPFSHIDGATIGADCRIGPYARIRPGSDLAEQVHIGNFVEIKNSDVASGSKINHLSYVGDSTIGREVNIGAGTITCNYDGVNKHRTVIEDGAFIGSDTQLVAPVTVGAGATIAAGSTITKHAPAGELTLSRGRQVTITGWKRPAKLVKNGQ